MSIDIIQEMEEYVISRALHKRPNAVMQLTAQKLKAYHDHLISRNLPPVCTFMGIPLQVPDPKIINMSINGVLKQVKIHPDGTKEFI